MNQLKISLHNWILIVLMAALFELKTFNPLQDLKQIIEDGIAFFRCCTAEESFEIKSCGTWEKGYTCNLWYAFPCEVADIPPPKEDKENPNSICIVSDDITMINGATFKPLGVKAKFLKYSDVSSEDGETIDRTFIWRIYGRTLDLERFKSLVKKKGIMTIAEDCNNYRWLQPGTIGKETKVIFSSVNNDDDGNYTDFTHTWSECKATVYTGTIPA